MKTMNPTHAKRILRLPLFALALLTGLSLFSMASAYAVNCSTSYFCYKTMTPQNTSRMPMSHPNQNWARRTADDQRNNRASRDETDLRSRRTSTRVTQQQNRRATPQARPRPTQARNTPPQLRPTPANSNQRQRPSTNANLGRCLNDRADLMKRAKSVESQAITQAKQKNQANAARLFRTAETMRKNAQNMRCR